MKKIISLFLIITHILPFVSSSLSSFAQELNVSVSARSAVLMLCGSNEIIYSKESDMQLPMASTTKIMTAVIVLERLPMDRVITVPGEACGVEGSSAYLYEGEKITAEYLLYALMLQSANDAAVALAIETAGSIEAFAELMNLKASELGLKNTHFSNPHGLDDDRHYSSAGDLALIMAYAMKNEAFRRITGTYKYTAPMQNRDETRLFVNHNKLLKSYEGCIGGKTGYTKKCGRCLVSVSEREGVVLICVTLDAPDDWKDHKSLFDYGFDLYERLILCEEDHFTYEIPIINGEKEYIRAQAMPLELITKREKASHITTVCELDRFYYADIDKGEVLGELVFFGNGKELARTPIIAKDSVKEIKYKSWWQKLLSIFFG